MFILEEQSKIPVTAEVDVLVIGSGPAGVSAAEIAEQLDSEERNY